MSHQTLSSKTVVVLGASYGGSRAARLLSQSLPREWRLVVVDRNSHLNHVYVFPRFTVLPKHAPKAYVPYSHLLAPPPGPDSIDPSFSSKRYPTVADTAITDPNGESERPESALTRSIPNDNSARQLAPSATDVHAGSSASLRTFIQGTVTSLSRNSVTFKAAGSRHQDATTGDATSGDDPRENSPASSSVSKLSGPEETLYFDYCIYALGSGMPDPVNVWSKHRSVPQESASATGSKLAGIQWMRAKSEQLRRANRIIVVGGGALGIQFATDLKEIYPAKKVTLLHSRERLMPIYPLSLHHAIIDKMAKLDIDVVLGDRVISWPDDPEVFDGRIKTIRTQGSRSFAADLILRCTGQKPHVSLMADLSPSSISASTSRIRVHTTMQVSSGSVGSPSGMPTTPGDIIHEQMADAHPGSAHPGPGVPSSAIDGDSQPSHGGEAEIGPDLHHIFAIGDCAETGAIQAGHTAHWQAEVAARNILRLIERRSAEQSKVVPNNENSAVDATRQEVIREPLESYVPSPPAVKISLGLRSYVTAIGDEVRSSEDGVEDLQARFIWSMLGAGDCDDEE